MSAVSEKLPKRETDAGEDNVAKRIWFDWTERRWAVGLN